MHLRRKEPLARALTALKAAENHKALNPRLLSVAPSCDYADYFLLLSASSPRHARALADAVLETGINGTGHIEGYTRGEWILLDLQDVVVHIFHEPVRSYYNFDKLWAHVPTVEAEDAAPAKKSASTGRPAQ